MKNSFISTKLRTTKSLDWAAPLKTYLKALYGTSLDLSSQISTFAKLRDCVKHHHDVNLDHLRDDYYKYYGQLELLDLRLPIGEGVRVKFTWHDSYDTSESHSQHSLAFEKASVLYNLGSVLSQLGALKAEEEDYKLSYQYFQYAAGVYKFVSENFLHAPSDDLSGKTMSFLLALELAQAQEVFLLKVMHEDGKASLISKMSQSCSTHYGTALEKFETLEDFGESSWKNCLRFKTKYYKGMALYQHALSVEEKKVGQAIVCIKLAIESWNECKPLDSMGIDVKSYITLADEKCVTLNKENDLIYHDLLPSKETIEIKGLDAAKAISLNDQKIERVIGEDIFEQVIPMNVHEKLSYYSEEKAKILRCQIENNETCDIELSSFLEYLKLPQSLQAFKNSIENKLDERLVSWSKTISASKLSGIDQNKQTVNFKRDKIMDLIRQLESRLEGEPDSGSSGLKEELMNAKQSLLSASTLDLQIYSTIEPEIANLQTLKSTSTLESSFFSNNNEVSLLDMDDSKMSASTKQSISKIESTLRVLNAMKTERSKVVEDIKTSIHEDDISNILILNNKKLSDAAEKQLFAQELTKFEPLTDRLDSIIFKQPQLIKEIKTNYDSIISANTGVSERAKKLSSYEKTFYAFKDYEVNFQKSVDFYDNLLKFVQDVEVNVNKFLADKESQRKRTMSKTSQPPANDLLRERFNNLSVSSQSPRGSFVGGPIPDQSYGGSANSFQPYTPSYQQDAPLPQVPYQQPVPPSQYHQPLAPSFNDQTSSAFTPQTQHRPQPSYYSSYDRPPQSQPTPGAHQPYQLQPPQQSQPPQRQTSYPSDRPVLPPKAPSTSQPSYQQSYQVSQTASMQQPAAQQNDSTRFHFYDEPSQFNSSMYDQFAKKPSTSGPGYAQPYDPTRPYNE